MGTTPVPKLVWTMSLPVMISMLIQALYNVVDSIFVARIPEVGEQALTAVSLAFPMQMLMFAFAIGTGVGANSLISRRLGERRLEAANTAATTGLILSFASAIVFVFVGLFTSGPFAAAFSDDAAIRELCTTYLFICITFSAGVFVQIMIERIMQATGNTLYPMIMQITGAVINIILDPILIFGLLGFPAMGIAGAAVATVSGQCAAALLSVLLLIFKKFQVKITFKGWRPDRNVIRAIYAVGIPAIVMQAVSSVMIFGMNVILIAFSSTAVAVFGIYFKLNSFVILPVLGLNNGCMPIFGYNFGARNKARLTATLRCALLYAVITMAIGTLAFWLFPAELLLLFNASPEMLTIGVHALRIISLCFMPAAVGIVLIGMFQGTGHGIKSLFMSLTRQLALILPIAYLLSRVSGLDGVWYAFGIAEVITAGLGLYFLRSLYKKEIHQFPDAPLSPPTASPAT